MRDKAASAAAPPEREPVQPFPRPAPKAGTNLVTPADVGSRVTFQFELPNGYTTEAVGIFERWDADAETYFVRKKDGTEVRVPGARRAPRQGHPRRAGRADARADPRDRTSPIDPRRDSMPNCPPR